MADNQGTYRIQIQVDGDNVTAALSGVNKQFLELSKVVSAANAKLRDQNKAHKGTANFYNQQIKLLTDLRDRLAKTTGETSKYNSAIDQLEKKKAALVWHAGGGKGCPARQGPRPRRRAQCPAIVVCRPCRKPRSRPKKCEWRPEWRRRSRG